MGWWKDTIEIAKEKIRRHGTPWKSLTYPGVKAPSLIVSLTGCGKMVLKLLARMHSQFGDFGPTLKFIQVQKLPRESLLIMAQDW